MIFPKSFLFQTEASKNSMFFLYVSEKLSLKNKNMKKSLTLCSPHSVPETLVKENLL